MPFESSRPWLRRTRALAGLVYRMLKYGQQYVDKGAETVALID
ncbi:MAG: hypothetical protein WBL50_26545 [Candidatus Acidiferrum sp.]